MNNPTKTIILGAVALLISWCSNFDTMTDQKIKELEAEKQKAQIACDQVQVMQKKIDGLLAYKGNAPTAEIKQEPTVAPVIWAYDCLQADNSIVYKEYDNNTMSYLKECWAFAWRSDCRIAKDWTNCLLKK